MALTLFNIISAVIGNPSFLIGLMTFIGLVLLRKSGSEILVGTVKAIVGFLILGGSAGIVVGAVGPLQALWYQGFGFKGILIDNEAVMGYALTVLGYESALSIGLGFLFNVIIARILPRDFRFIFLTGHHTMWIAMMLVVILQVGGFSGWTLILLTSIGVGLASIIYPWLAHPHMMQVTKGQPVAFGHYGTTFYVASGLVGELIGDPAKSTEEYKVPKGLEFMKDTTIITAIAAFVFYLLPAIPAGAEYIETTLAPGQPWLFFCLMTALTFTSGIVAMLVGVRMILAEIVPAFSGIAKTIVPDALPALDCPAVFPFAPTAVPLGFVCSTIGGIVGMYIQVAMNASGIPITIILPGSIPHFFCGGTAAVFGNATGGRLGAVLGSFVHGLGLAFVPALMYPLLGVLGFAGATFGDTDFGWTGVITGNLVKIYTGVDVVTSLLYVIVFVAYIPLLRWAVLALGKSTGKITYYFKR